MIYYTFESILLNSFSFVWNPDSFSLLKYIIKAFKWFTLGEATKQKPTLHHSCFCSSFFALILACHMYIVMFFVFANDAVNWCYLVCMFEKTTHRWLAVFSLCCGETLLLCGQLQDLWTPLIDSTPFWSGQADQLSPFSPCMSQVLHYCRLGFSALNVFLLHPGLMMQEFLENGNCLGWVQEDDSPFCRISTILWT